MELDYFKERRSCRNFKADKIDRGVLTQIIDMASKSPTCGNMQLYSVIVTEDAGKLKEMAGYHFNQPAAATAPMILTICADFHRFNEWCKIRNAKSGFNNFHSFIMAMTDAVIFSQQLVTVAEILGLGTCYLGTVNYNAKEIAEMLSLPDLVIPVAAVAIGYPEIQGEPTLRLPVDGIMHFESYPELSPKDLEKIYSAEENDSDNKKYIKENGKENLAQLFAEVRYPGELNEQVSHSFYSLIKSQGF